MKRFFALLLTYLLLTQALLQPVSASPALSEAPDTEFDGYLVSLADGAAPQSGEDLTYVMPQVYETQDLALVRALLESGRADYAEYNYIVELCTDQGELPPAPLYEDRWAYELMGLPLVENLCLTGEGVRIGIIDSGIDASNKDLTQANIAEGWDYIRGCADMCDEFGHGTKVAQMIVGDRNYLGTTGVARGATIVPLRCFDGSGACDLANLCTAVYDAAYKYDCDIVNMSWSMPSNSKTLEKKIEQASERGCILVAAAGNVGTLTPQGKVLYPAAYDAVIGVGSVDSAGLVSATSQQTKAVFVCAPGKSVPVYYGEKSTTVTGTSFASPLVAGALALIKQLQPALDAPLAMALLRERAVDCGDAGYDIHYGYGFVDVSKLLASSWLHTEQTDAGLLLRGFLRAESSGFAVAAGYRESGQMTACTLVRFKNRLAPIAKTFPHTDTLRFFYDPW